MNILGSDDYLKKEYNDLAMTIYDAFNIMQQDNRFKLKKEDVLTSFDSYFTALVFDSILMKRKLYLGEINYMNNLTRYCIYFKEINLSINEEPNDNIISFIASESKKILSEAPSFALLCVMIDKRIENNNTKSSETYSSIFYNTFVKIRNYLCEDENVPNNLAVLYDYFKSQKVIY